MYTCSKELVTGAVPDVRIVSSGPGQTVVIVAGHLLITKQMSDGNITSWFARNKTYNRLRRKEEC